MVIDSIIQTITHLITAFITKTGYGGIFLLMTAEAALIPIPSEVTLPFSGFLAALGKFNLLAVVTIGALGDLVGSLLAFWLGFWAKGHVIKSWIRRYGKFLLVSEVEYNQSERWFRRHGEKIVFFSRMLPIVRTFISLPVGVSRMNVFKFALFTFIGSFIWSAALANLGYYLGANWQALEPIYRQFEYLIIGVLVILAIWYIFRKVKHLK